MSAAGLPGLVRRVLIPFALAYVLSYLYRTVNAVIAPDLVAGFDLSPAQLGLLTSAYFLTFAAFQLPLGLLLDRFGPRRTDAALLVVAAGGAFLFATAGSVSTLALGRALIGLGVSGCLMSGIKANVLWFPAQRLPAMNGWMFFAGGIGMVAATVPVELALKVTDWRVMFAFLAVLTLLAAATIVHVVPEHPRTTGADPFSIQLRGLRDSVSSLSALPGRPRDHSAQRARVHQRLSAAMGHGRHHRALAGPRWPLSSGRISRGVRRVSARAGAGVRMGVALMGARGQVFRCRQARAAIVNTDASRPRCGYTTWPAFLTLARAAQPAHRVSLGPGRHFDTSRLGVIWGRRCEKCGLAQLHQSKLWEEK
jgi:MFS family permease